MNKDAQEYLNQILSKDPQWLRQDEIDFLKARRDYLTSEQKRVFTSVLQSEEEQEALPVEDTEQEQEA